MNHELKREVEKVIVENLEIKNAVFCDVKPCGYRMKDVSEERIAPIIG
jgi:hypothetical protein